MFSFSLLLNVCGNRNKDNTNNVLFQIIKVVNLWLPEIELQIEFCHKFKIRLIKFSFCLYLYSKSFYKITLITVIP